MKNFSTKTEAIAKKKSGKYEDWQLEEFVSALERAEEIKADKNKMNAIAPILKRKSKALKSIEDLRKRAIEVMEDDDGEEPDIESLEDED